MTGSAVVVSDSPDEEETAWGLIAVAVALVVACALAAGWAIGRRREARGHWRADARQAAADGALLNTAVAGALRTTSAGNDPAAWAGVASAAAALARALERLEADAPDEHMQRSVRESAEAVAGLGAAIAVAQAVPRGTVLDAPAVQVLQDRLDATSASLVRLGASANEV